MLQTKAAFLHTGMRSVSKVGHFSGVKVTIERQKKAPKKLGELPIYQRNPSVPVPGQITKLRSSRLGDDRKGVLVDQDSGEIFGPGGATFYEIEEVDKERFVKLYLAGLKSAVGMTKAGLRVFEMVYDQMREHQERDFVLFASRRMVSVDSQFTRGLRELLDRQFLFRTEVGGMFWVNIQFMFNGDRLAFVKAYRLKTAESRQLNMLSQLEPESGND
jgi:hypothetical protein